MKTNECETVAETCKETVTAGVANAHRVALTLKGGKELKKGVALLKTCVMARAKLPCLGMVLIESEGQGVARLTTNNSDMSVSVCVPGVWSEADGMPLGIPFKALEAGAKSGGDCVILADVKQDGTISASVNGLPCFALKRDEFPPDFLNREEEICAFEMPMRAFARELAFTEPAQSEDGTRPAINSVYLKASANDEGKTRFECVATDGRRLHKGAGFDAMAEYFASERKGLGVIVPLNAIKAIRASLVLGNRVFIGVNGKAKDEPTHLTVCVRGGALPIDFGTKLVQWNYPNYTNVIPRNNPTTGHFKPCVVSEVAEKLKAWRLANGGNAKECTSYPVAFKNEAGKLWAMAVASGKEAQFELTGCELKTVKECKDGETMIAIDANYLIDAMAVNEGSESVEISVKDEVSPMIVKSENGLAVVMPIRLK